MTLSKSEIEIIGGGLNKLHYLQGEMFFSCAYCGVAVMLDKVSDGEYPIQEPDTHHDDYEGKCECGKIGVTVNIPHDRREPKWAEYSLTPHDEQDEWCECYICNTVYPINIEHVCRQ